MPPHPSAPLPSGRRPPSISPAALRLSERMPPKASAKKQTSKPSPAGGQKSLPEMRTAPKTPAASKPNPKASSKTIVKKPKGPPSVTPENEPKSLPTHPPANTSSRSHPEAASEAEVVDADAVPKVEPDVEIAAPVPGVPAETAASKAKCDVEAAEPQADVGEKYGESQTLQSEVEGVAAATTSPGAQSGDNPPPKTKKKIIRRVIVRTRKVPVQKKVPAGENPNPASKDAINPVSVPAHSKDPSPSPHELSKPRKEEDVKPLQAAPVRPAEVKKQVEENKGPGPATIDKDTLAGAGKKPLSGEETGVDLWVDEFEVAERRKKRRTEIFVGGLDKEAKEEDIRKVFEKVGEIVEVRLMKNIQTGKNKGYAFLRYAKPAEAQRALNELARAEVCGKPCAAAPLQDNDTIFLGSIDKRWKKEDVIKILQEIGVENIHTVYVMMDPNNPSQNRGFAFLELETNKDAQNAYRKLQKKDIFGKGRNIKVAWAEPLNDPGEEEMQKVKSVYANGIPTYWDEENVKKYFSKFGEIERVKLAKDMHNPKRKDFAFINYATREAALACIESFNKEELIDKGSKVNIKVMLAKPVQKGNQNKGRAKVPDMEQSKETIKQFTEKIKEAHEHPMESILPFKKGRFIGKDGPPPSIEKKSSDTEELIQVLREQAAWRQGISGLSRVSAVEDYSHGLPGGKRPFSSLGEDPYSDTRGYSRGHDSSFPLTSTSYSSFSYDGTGTSLPFYENHSAGYAGSAYTYGSDYSTSGKMRYGTYSYGGDPSLRY
ncbi:unnamed protein product [Victoria cruziana]